MASKSTVPLISVRKQVGLAALFEVNVDAGSHAIDVRLPRRNDLSRLQPVSVSGDSWLGISLRHNDKFDLCVSVSFLGNV